MKRPLLLCALLALAGCQSSIENYHHEAANPYRVAETSLRLSVAGLPADKAAASAAMFAAERPNNGSTFIVSAPADVVGPVRAALIQTGVDPRDIRVVPEGNPAEVVRTDRFATAAGCIQPPRRMGLGQYMFGVEEGFQTDETQSSLFGCAVKRNITEMVDDPRALKGMVHNGGPEGGRDGTKAADVYGKWSRAASPWASYQLPTWTTSDITSGGSGQ